MEEETTEDTVGEMFLEIEEETTEDTVGEMFVEIEATAETLRMKTR